MTSLQSCLPPPGSSNWHRSSSSLSKEGPESANSVRHAIIREVWLEKRPSPHAVYKIEIMSNSSHWFVFRRFKEFHTLHQKLAKKFGIPKDFLPPKKLTNNMSIETLEQRREALEHYLQRLINSCDREVCSCPELLEFLDLKGHDVSLVVMSLTKNILNQGELILQSNELFTMTPVQLHCLTKQLQLPHPPKGGNTADLGHLYDFMSQLGRLRITDLVSRASNGKQFEINYSYDLSMFSRLNDLQIDGCRVSSISGIHSLPQRLKLLTARYCVHTMKELLIDCAAEKRPALVAKTVTDSWRTQAAYRLSNKRVIVQPWVCLTSLNMSHNNILGLDSSMALLPALRELDLSNNKMAHLDLSLLEDSPLQKLTLVGNEIYLISGSTKTLNNLKILNLKQNRIQSIEGLLCAQGLIKLDLSHNSIVLISEARKLAALENLKSLFIAGNTMCRQKRHRVMIFASFRNRQLELDGKEVGRKEKAKLEAKFTAEDNVDFDDSMSISTVSDDDLDSGIDGHVPSLEPLFEEEDFIVLNKDVSLVSLTMGESSDHSDSREGSYEASPLNSPHGSPRRSPANQRRQRKAREEKSSIVKALASRDVERARNELESFSSYEESFAANWKPKDGRVGAWNIPGDKLKKKDSESGHQDLPGQVVRKRVPQSDFYKKKTEAEKDISRQPEEGLDSRKKVNKAFLRKNPSLTSFDKMVKNLKKKNKNSAKNTRTHQICGTHQPENRTGSPRSSESSRLFEHSEIEDSNEREFKGDVLKHGFENKKLMILPEVHEIRVEDCDEDELWNGEEDCEAGLECDEIL